MKVTVHQYLAIYLVALTCAPSAAQAGSDGNSALSGDRGGLCSRWAERGVNIEASYTAAALSNRRVDIRNGTVTLSNIDLLLDLRYIASPGVDPAWQTVLVRGARFAVSPEMNTPRKSTANPEAVQHA